MSTFSLFFQVGIQEVFSTNANLTGMIQWVNYELHVSNFLHKAKIEINEEGTVAAAATGKFSTDSFCTITNTYIVFTSQTRPLINFSKFPIIQKNA